MKLRLIIKFVLTAVGCSDVIPPEDAWLKRKGDDIVIGCYSSRQTWHLSCQEWVWTGVVGNCSVKSKILDCLHVDNNNNNFRVSNIRV